MAKAPPVFPPVMANVSVWPSSGSVTGIMPTKVPAGLFSLTPQVWAPAAGGRLVGAGDGPAADAGRAGEVVVRRGRPEVQDHGPGGVVEAVDGEVVGRPGLGLEHHLALRVERVVVGGGQCEVIHGRAGVGG